MIFREKNIGVCNDDIDIDNLKYFKEEELIRHFKLQDEKPDMKQIYDISINSDIIDFKLIKTNREVSNEGKKLLGYKLITEILLNFKITYIIDNPQENICTTTFKILKSITIILPKEIESRNIGDMFKMKRVNVIPHIQHYNARQLDKRNFNISTLILLDVKLC